MTISKYNFLLLLILVSKSWGYFDYKNGTDWEGVCNNGKRQSPIDINCINVTCKEKSDINIVLNGFDEEISNPTMVNNGHAVQIDLKDKGNRIAYIKGADFSENPHLAHHKKSKPFTKYKLEQIHFHWGENDITGGSEHTINGKRMDLESHLVFWNMNYESFKKACESKKDDGLLVVATQYKIENNSKGETIDLGPIATCVDRVRTEKESFTYNGKFILADIMPKNYTGFYLYGGSLTTPPCTETVTWIVLREVMPISKEQWKKFTYIKNHDGAFGKNFRKIQPLNDRMIYNV